MITEFKSKHIGVLYGGVSQERDVSLRSGKNVYDALVTMGYNTSLVDLQSDSIDKSKIDVAFIALHGPEYEDGSLQAFLETCHIPYTGCGVTASLIGMDKAMTKSVCREHHIPVPDFSVLNTPSSSLPPHLTYPVIAKPLREGSSIDVSIIHSDAELKTLSAKLHRKYGTYLLDTFIKGTEVTVGIIDHPSPTPLPILELKPKNIFYDYEAKYTPGLTEFILPSTLSSDVSRSIENYALQLYNACHCSGMARIDFMVCPNQGPFVLEVNTIPGLTDLSDLPAQAKHHGISFAELITIILRSALPRFTAYHS